MVFSHAILSLRKEEKRKEGMDIGQSPETEIMARKVKKKVNATLLYELRKNATSSEKALDSVV